MRRWEETRADRLMAAAERKGDYRKRCEAEAHLLCTRCGVCACDSDDVDLSEFPEGVVRVTTDKENRTWCRECRRQRDYFGNV